MPQCPQCNKAYRVLPRKCTSCMAELDLLVEYVDQLKVGLEQAERWTRAGELGKAFWAYLAVLEIDPDNPTARRQVGQAVTAVRQFDRTAPSRRWLVQLRREANPTRWRWIWAGFAGAVVVAFALGFLLGGYGEWEWNWPTFELPTGPPDNSAGGK